MACHIRMQMDNSSRVSVNVTRCTGGGTQWPNLSAEVRHTAIRQQLRAATAALRATPSGTIWFFSSRIPFRRSGTR